MHYSIKFKPTSEIIQTLHIAEMKKNFKENIRNLQSLNITRIKFSLCRHECFRETMSFDKDENEGNGINICT